LSRFAIFSRILLRLTWEVLAILFRSSGTYR
jgi:hypothetical protein